MPTAFLFHGFGGNAQENWFPWLKKELETLRLRVVAPDFPDAEKPSLERWRSHFTEHENALDGDSIFIGHSLGAAFALRLLARIKAHSRATILVSPVWKTPDVPFAPLLTTFTDPPFDWTAIRRNAGTLEILHGSNDPYLPLPYVEELKRNLRCPLTIIEGGKHLNAAAGYRKFPALLQSVQSLLSNKKN
jgi:predicted alpha/beta hydrolase family esterase